jgi:tRNA threonylcarbamoyladenosine biosynthesis protein TsaB
MARFAAMADPQKFPPDPTYIRAADAKPQTKAQVARR